jgi:hypothetical protein
MCRDAPKGGREMNETRKNIALQDRQLKVSIELSLAETFKASCAARRVSMAS